MSSKQTVTGVQVRTILLASTNYHGWLKLLIPTWHGVLVLACALFSKRRMCIQQNWWSTGGAGGGVRLELLQ